MNHIDPDGTFAWGLIPIPEVSIPDVGFTDGPDKGSIDSWMNDILVIARRGCQYTGSCVGTQQSFTSSILATQQPSRRSGGAVISRLKRDTPPMEPSTQKYLCGKLSANGFNIPKTYRSVLSDRRGKTNGRINWSVPEFRQSENFLYATGKWRSPSTDGSTYLGVYAHQYLKYFRSNTTDFSLDALDAGLDGVDHKNDTPAELKAFCNAN